MLDKAGSTRRGEEHRFLYRMCGEELRGRAVACCLPPPASQFPFTEQSFMDLKLDGQPLVEYLPRTFLLHTIETQLRSHCGLSDFGSSNSGASLFHARQS